jgi:cytochrome P450
MNVALFDPSFNADPHPTYERLRTEAPVCRVALPDRGEVWLVTRYADVLEVLRDDVRFSTRSMLSQTGELPDLSAGAREVMRLFESFMSSNDPPVHTRLRSLVQKAFTPRLVQGMQPYVQSIADQLLDAAEEQARATGDRTMDLIADFAFPLPVTVIMKLLGVPPDRRDDLRRWSQALVRFDRSPRSAEALAGEIGEFIDYTGQLLDTKRRHPEDDLLTALVDSRNSGLSEMELISMVSLLIFAGHETTTHLIGNGVLALLDHPAEFERLRESPAGIRWAVEELLRYDGPIEIRRRIAVEDVEIGGMHIRRGDIVLVSLAAANRDPACFPVPGEFDIARDDNHHIAFGRGIHACLGATLARLEVQISISTLLRRMPSLRLAVARSDLRWRPSGLHLRGLAALPVCF